MDKQSLLWVNSKIILIIRWDLNILLLQANPLKCRWALNLLIVVIAKLSANECKTSAKKTKNRSENQSHIHSFHWTRRLTGTVCSLHAHFYAVLSVHASVFLWLCSRALWAPSSTFSTDSEAMRSKRNCEVAKASRVVQEEVFFLISLNFFSACNCVTGDCAHYAKWKLFNSKFELFDNVTIFFILYLTLFLNLTCWSQSIMRAKTQNNTKLTIGLWVMKPGAYGAAGQVTTGWVTNVSQKWCIFIFPFV